MAARARTIVATETTSATKPHVDKHRCERERNEDDRILDGRAEPADIDAMLRVASTMKSASRCGLGQTACNPVLTSIEGARYLYDRAVATHPMGYRRSFELDSAVATAKALRDRTALQIPEYPGWAD